MNAMIAVLLSVISCGYVYGMPPRGAVSGAILEGHCKFDKTKDYAPNSPSMVRLTRLPVPELQTDIINSVSSISGEIARRAAMGESSVTVINAIFGSALPREFIKAAPILSPVLGVVRDAMGIKAANNDDSMTKILENTREALEKLSSQVERKFDNMQEYVEGNFIRQEKEDTLDELKEIFEAFVNCADRRTDAEINTCNREKSFSMIAKRSHFKLFEEEFKARNNLKILDAKKIEATLPITRDYVFKYLLMLQNYFVREQLLNADDLHYFEVFTRKIIQQIPVFIDYAKWGYNQIIRAHTTGNCVDYQCGGWIYRGNKRTMRCSCHMDKTDMSKSCIVATTYGKNDVRGMNAYSTNIDLLRYRLKRQYVDGVRNEVKRYWKKEILDPIESWKRTVAKIKESRKLANVDDVSGSGSGESESESED